MHTTPMSAQILKEPSQEDLLLIEQAGRTCYKSDSQVSENSYGNFIRKIIELGHESVIEHAHMTVKIVANRGVTHELVRHRLASFSQESTRYCNYSKDRFGQSVEFVLPGWSMDYSIPSETRNATLKVWQDSMKEAEKAYFALLEQGLSPQYARGVLPIDLKTEIVVTANLRQWRHIFNLRCDKAAHPDIRSICNIILKNTVVPVVFDDLKEKYLNSN